MSTVEDILIRYYLVLRWLILADETPPSSLDWAATVLVCLTCAILGVVIVTPALLHSSAIR